MPSAASKTSSSTLTEARMSPLKRLGPSNPKPVVRVQFKQRTSIRKTPSIKREFLRQRSGPYRPKKLGEGGWGKVSRMYERGSLQPYAVKEVFKVDVQKEEDYDNRVHDEFDIASRLRHPNVVETSRLRTRRFRLCQRRWCIVMEYCANGDVFDSVAARHLSPREKLCLFKQLLHGVEYLHSQGVAHRDIKIENLLLNETGHLKIADFGLSTTGDLSHQLDALGRCSGDVGTPLIEPPEALEPFYDGRAFDVWSCAMTLLVMLDPELRNWHSGPSATLYVSKWRSHLGDKGKSLHPDTTYYGASVFALRTAPLQRLLLAMLHPDPAQRLTASQVLDDPFVREIECCCPVLNSRDQGPPAQHYHGPPPCLPPPPVRLTLNFRRIKDAVMG